MNELFREIEEDIRAERLQKLWRRFGRAAVWASAAVVAATIVGVAWNRYQHAQSEKHTQTLIAAAAQAQIKDFKAAEALLAPLTGDSGSRYFAVALWQQAQNLEASGEREAAIGAYATLAKSKGDDAALFADLAKIKLAGLSDQDVEPQKHSPLYYSVAEARIWQLFRLDKKDEAKKRMAELADDANAPASMRERMGLMAGGQ